MQLYSSWKFKVVQETTALISVHYMWKCPKKQETIENQVVGPIPKSAKQQL